MIEVTCIDAWCNGKDLNWMDYAAIVFNIIGIPVIFAIAVIIVIILFMKNKK